MTVFKCISYWNATACISFIARCYAFLIFKRLSCHMTLLHNLLNAFNMQEVGQVFPYLYIFIFFPFSLFISPFSLFLNHFLFPFSLFEQHGCMSFVYNAFIHFDDKKHYIPSKNKRYPGNNVHA